jgi:glycine cleavage system H protein
MSKIPTDLLYAKSHEWIKLCPDGTAFIGITDYAQSSLGDITFVQLPKAGAVLTVGETFGVVESVKAASDLYAPATFTVIEVNAALNTSPELLNSAPYTEAWMLRVSLTSAALTHLTDTLLDAVDYGKQLG